MLQAAGQPPLVAEPEGDSVLVLIVAPLWAQVRWVPGGHVSAFLFQQGAFRSAITDSLGRLSRPQGEERASAEAA